MISPIFKSLRPKHWIKNLLLFAVIVFSSNSIISSKEAWLYVLAGFVIFCGLSGAVYILNDIIDLANDRIHPIKCNRPIASGLLSVKEAKAAMLLLLIICLFASWYISPMYFSIALCYFMLNLAYSFKLKKIVIIDAVSVGFCFVLRALAGVGALKAVYQNVFLDNSIILSIFFWGMFLAFIKRREEILIAENKAVIRQKEFSKYTINYIDQISSILVTLSIGFYSFYASTVNNTDAIYSKYLIYSVPFIIYGFLRYLYVIHNNEENEILSD